MTSPLQQIENLWKTLGVGEETTDELFSTAIYDILPVSPSFSHYMGSLTTPPCSEVCVCVDGFLAFRWWAVGRYRGL